MSYHRNKVDTTKVSMFKIKIQVNQSIYRGTIMDCKLIKNMMMIKDCFQIMGNNIIDMDMLEKMIYLDNIIINQFQKDYCNNFSLKINKLYQYDMLNEVIHNIIPKCNIDTQGLIFLPKKSGISIIFVDKRPDIAKVEITPTQNTPNIHMVHDLTKFLLSRNYSYETNCKKKNLTVEKTNTTDVYYVYDNNEKLGIAHIPSIKISHYCYENIKDRALCLCAFHTTFNKWIPLKVI